MITIYYILSKDKSVNLCLYIQFIHLTRLTPFVIPLFVWVGGVRVITIGSFKDCNVT
jgi:hypothetical protein